MFLFVQKKSVGDLLQNSCSTSVINQLKYTCESVPFSLQSDSHLPKKFIFICFNESSFRSQDIPIFVLTFWSYRRSGLIRKTRLISNFLTSQPGQQTIAIHILPNISRSKGKQTLKFGQVIEYIKRNIFLQNSCRK